MPLKNIFYVPAQLKSTKKELDTARYMFNHIPPQPVRVQSWQCSTFSHTIGLTYLVWISEGDIRKIIEDGVAFKAGGAKNLTCDHAKDILECELLCQGSGKHFLDVSDFLLFPSTHIEPNISNYLQMKHITFHAYNKRNKGNEGNRTVGWVT